MDLSFAGFATTGEVASTHSELRTAKKQSVFAKRGFPSMAGSRLVPCRDDAAWEARQQVSARRLSKLKPSGGRCMTTELR
jgi:hypothetical protein